MTEPGVVEDPRLWAMAYIRFFVKDADEKSRKSRMLLESDARYMARAVGNFALFLMDSVWLPVQFGVEWTDSWVEIDSLKRTNPAFKMALLERERYRRMGLGYSLLPRQRLRRTARQVVGMLWLAYQAEAGSDGPLLYGSEPIVEMLQRYQNRFGHSGGTAESA
ncbi:hypothetical protein [Streptomyces sp. WAC 06738]|uniref:hypothetical protein n=1 Tax=Streptomyces sp. WAC 06738 TaxID=2203210 RepID=UPI000F76F627|nr:hypothetical protein [Streptomyces sp. WAC 06738]